MISSPAYKEFAEISELICFSPPGGASVPLLTEEFRLNIGENATGNIGLGRYQATYQCAAVSVPHAVSQLKEVYSMSDSYRNSRVTKCPCCQSFTQKMRLS